MTLSPGGVSQMKMDIFGTTDDNCSDNVEGLVTITVANGDKLTLTLFVPSTSGATFATTFVVTGGTGQYAGKGGSGTGTIALGSGPPNISLSLTLTGNITGQYVPTASIRPSGVVPVGHSRVTIQPGSWVSIYGTNLANATATWDGVSADIPTSLGGVTATINGKPAFFWFTSSGQINLQAPDDTFRGCANVTLNTPNGPATSRVQIATSAPSLNLLDARYPAAVIPTSAGGGAHGGGTYDLAGPAGRFSYSTRPVKKGETVVLYGVGMGPTEPAVPAGKGFSGSAPVASTGQVSVLINRVRVTPTYVGLVGAGLYQINVVVPTTAISGDNVLEVSTQSGRTVDGLFLTVQ